MSGITSLARPVRIRSQRGVNVTVGRISQTGGGGGGGGGEGDVVGPSSAVDGRPALFDGTSGKLLKVGAVNAPDGLARLNGSGVLPDTQIDSNIVRHSELDAALAGYQPVGALPLADPLLYTAGTFVLSTAGLGTGAQAASPAGSTANSDGYFAFVPWSPPHDMDLVGFAVAVQTGNAEPGAVVDCMLFAADPSTGLPGAVVVGSQTAGINTTGLKEMSFAATPVAVGERFWVAVGFRGLNSAGSNPQWLRATASSVGVAETAPDAGSTSQFGSLRAIGASSGLSASPSVSVSRSTIAILPHVWLKVG